MVFETDIFPSDSYSNNDLGGCFTTALLSHQVLGLPDISVFQHRHHSSFRSF